VDDFIKTPPGSATSNVPGAGPNQWGAVFALMRTIDVPSEFIAEREMNIPPLEMQVFTERAED